jgi:hypothetical protein
MRNAVLAAAAIGTMLLVTPSLSQVKDQTASRSAVRIKPPASAASDQVSTQSELDALRMQQLMERRTKTESTMSNVLQKQREAASGTIGNLK